MLDRLVNSSTDIAPRCLGTSSSYMSSLCGVPRRQYVDRRIFVSIVERAAFGTIPLTHRQRQRFFNVATDVASFAGWEKAVDLLQFFPISSTLVVKQQSHGAERGIRQRTGKTLVFGHSMDVEVFDTDSVKTPHQVGCDLMQIVCSNIGDAHLDFCDSQSGPFSSVTPLLSAGENSLCTGQLFQVPVQIPGIGDVFSVRECGKAVDPQINTNGLLGFGIRIENFVEAESHKISTGTVLGYRDRSGLTIKAPAPAYFQFSEFGDRQDAVSILERGAGIFGRLPTALAFKFWVLRAFVEEVLKRRLKVSQRLLKRDARHFVQPGVFRFFFEPGQRRRAGVVINRLAALVGVRAQTQCPVVDKASAPKGACKVRPLLFGWVKSVSVSDFHKNNIAFVKVLCNSKRRRRFLPALKDGVSAPKKR